MLTTHVSSVRWRTRVSLCERTSGCCCCIGLKDPSAICFISCSASSSLLETVFICCRPRGLREVLAAPNRGDYFIGGAVEACTRSVVPYRGTLEPLVLPFSWFLRRSPQPAPDFRDFEVTDYGLTARFGPYETSTDAILYMHDSDYRRKAKERQLERDDSFGARLRRLRLMKGVPRDDFPGVSEKQVARIERGEIERPHRRTLRLIAERLGVEPGDISTY